VQRRPDRPVVRIVPRSPGAGEAFVGPAAEQEYVGALVDLVHNRRGFVVQARPSAALEPAALVFLRPSGPLHHSINGDLRGGRQFHGLVPSPVVVFLVMTAPRRGSHRSSVARRRKFTLPPSRTTNPRSASIAAEVSLRSGE